MKKILVLIVVSVIFGLSCSAPKEGGVVETKLQKIKNAYSTLSPAEQIALDRKRNPPVTAPGLNMKYRDATDPWQMKNLGDSFDIELLRNVDSWQLNYTSLGISDVDAGKFNIKAYYYEDNKVSYENYKVFVELVDPATLGYTWSLYSKPNTTTQAATLNPTADYFSQLYDFATNPNINWSFPINRSSIVLIYTPTIGTNDWHFKYYLKGLNDGTGGVEIVGYEVYKYEPLENVGDTNFSDPYVPTYIE